MHPRFHFRHIVYLALAIIITACTPATSTPTPAPYVPSDGSSGSSALPETFYPTAGSIMPWGDGSNIVYIPPEEFDMGAGSEADNAPAHIVSLDGFWIQENEVTNRSYQRCVASGGCTPPGGDGADWFADPFYADYPVTGVDWFQAQAYCTWTRGTLPTEAQWELAAAGPAHNLYPWGSVEPACDLLNFDNCLNPSAPDFVGSYAMGASYYQLLDMGGNVFEWVADFYAPDYYLTSPAVNPLGPGSGDLRVVRGGGYDSSELLVRTSTRGAMDPTLQASNVGFRCTITSQSVARPTLPLCQVAAYLPSTGFPGRDQEGSPEGEAGPITILGGYCDNSLTGMLTGINIDVGQPITNPDDYIVTAQDERLECVQTSGYPNRLTCYGAPLDPDHSVVVTVCPPSGGGDDDTSKGQPVCDTGYIFDTSSGKCVYTPVDQPEGGCPPGFQTTTNTNCLPMPNDDGGCPQGYFQTYINDVLTCAPVGDPSTSCTYGMYATSTQVNCPPDPPCLPGYTYNPELLCCEPPLGSQPECPQYTTFSTSLNYCEPTSRGRTSQDCVTSKVYIPSCVTPVTNPTRGPFTCIGLTYDLCIYYSSYCYWDTSLGCQPIPSP